MVEKILDMNPEASAGDFGGERRITARMRGYKQLNLVSGAAGTGKTTGFLRAFETDERIDDVLMCFPNNELRSSFSKRFPKQQCMTH